MYAILMYDGTAVCRSEGVWGLVKLSYLLLSRTFPAAFEEQIEELSLLLLLCHVLARLRGCYLWKERYGIRVLQHG